MENRVTLSGHPVLDLPRSAAVAGERHIVVLRLDIARSA